MQVAYSSIACILKGMNLGSDQVHCQDESVEVAEDELDRAGEEKLPGKDDKNRLNVAKKAWRRQGEPSHET